MNSSAQVPVFPGSCNRNLIKSPKSPRRIQFARNYHPIVFTSLVNGICLYKMVGYREKLASLSTHIYFPDPVASFDPVQITTAQVIDINKNNNNHPYVSSHRSSISTSQTVCPALIKFSLRNPLWFHICVQERTGPHWASCSGICYSNMYRQLLNVGPAKIWE